MTDAVLVDVGTAGKVTQLLEEEDLPPRDLLGCRSRPASVENVKAGVRAFEESGADVIIGLGGGSPQDTGKAIGIIANNPSSRTCCP